MAGTIGSKWWKPDSGRLVGGDRRGQFPTKFEVEEMELLISHAIFCKRHYKLSQLFHCLPTVFLVLFFLNAVDYNHTFEMFVADTLTFGKNTSATCQSNVLPNKTDKHSGKRGWQICQVANNEFFFHWIVGTN